MTVNYAKFNFNVTGAKRKELVSLISRFTGCDAKYKGAPSFAYEVDYFTIDKNGTLIFDDRADSEVIERLLEMLYDNGFTAENDDAEPQTEETGLTIEIPRDKVDVENLINLLESKGELIKAALGIEDIRKNLNWYNRSLQGGKKSEGTTAETVFFQAGLCAVTAVSSSVLRFGSQIQSTEKQYGNATTSLKMSINVKLRI